MITLNKSINRFLVFSQILLLSFLFVLSAKAASGDVDTAFDTSLIKSRVGPMRKSLVQPDGKIIIVGWYQTSEGEPRTGVTRFNADGTLDTTFNPPDMYNSGGYSANIYSVALQSTGKIIIVGDILGVNGISRLGVIRLNQDGSFDNTFAFVPLSVPNFVVVYPDDKMIVGGGIHPLNADGTFDNSKNFPNVSTSAVALQTDGKLLVNATINNTRATYRFNSDGSLDNSFTPIPTSANDIEIQPDGKIIVIGSFTTVNGFPISGIFRANSDGSIDPTFNPNGTGASGSVTSVSIGSNGKIAIGGTFPSYNSTPKNRIAVLNSDGTLDTTFTYQQLNPVGINDVNLQSNGKLIVSADGYAFRLNSDGSFDPSFLTYARNAGIGYKTVVQPDGKILVGGNFQYTNGQLVTNLVRYNPDGSIDNSFTPALRSTTDQVIYDIDVQPSGKILISGRLFPVTNNFNERIALRLNSDGSLDLENLSGNSSTLIRTQSDGKFFIGTIRHNEDGTLDNTFNSQITSGVNDLVVQSDGKIVVGGTFTQVNGMARGRIARLNSDGSLDMTFNPPGGANGTVRDVSVQADGKILIGGDFTSVNFDNNRKYLTRFNTDGSLDTGFVSPINTPVLRTKLQSDGKIIYSLVFTTLGEVNPKAIARLNSNGSADSTFNIGAGANGQIESFDFQADNKIIVVGGFLRINSVGSVGIARLLNNSAPTRTLFDFDGDGKSDVSVFRSSTNRWYEILSGNSSVFEAPFGVSGDIVAPADFDGDGKTDLAIFRPSLGNWWYLSSVDNSQKSVQFGASGDIPRPSDFDGDGRDDFVVFRPSNSTWYRLSSGTGAVSVITFGTNGDKPLVGDFDGDGKSDVAIYRPSTGTWWYQSSVNNAQIATSFGVATDIAVPADYDGDGKTDLAVYRPSTGVWYILNSSTGQATIVGFGLSEDKPVAADYDGDGRADIGVFRPSTGVWYLLRSSQGFTALQFGISTDIPIPNSFVQ